jgi:hypothetical protein
MMSEPQGPKEERSLGELLADLTREITALVRQEATLAKAEVSQKAARVGKDVGFLAAGGAIAYAGLLAILAGIILFLGQTVMPWWAAALLVGVIVAGIGGFLVMNGLNALKHEDLVPRQAVEALTENRNESANVRRPAV